MAVDGNPPDVTGQAVRITLLHTADIHSRLNPYDFDPSYTDNGLGLADDVGPYGGIARVAYVIKRERANSRRVLHLDTGDSFQGSIVFNEYDGEAEFRTLSAIGLNAATLANHEFDKGAENIATQASNWANFPLLAANYDFADSTLPYASELEDLIQPTAMFDLEGVRIGVIGMANISSLNSLDEESNSLGIKTREIGEVIPQYAALLKAQGANLIVVLSHLGVETDEEIAHQFPEVDLILGGHNHIALDPPMVIVNDATGKRIPIVHSGAFAKFVGRLDLVVKDDQILSTDYTLFPIDNSVPEDPEVAEIMAGYNRQIAQDINVDQVLGYAESQLGRYGSTGGDSMLGHFTAEAMRSFPGVETQISLTNTLGIRSDIPAGDITVNALYNTMPFDNTITTMFLSGLEVQELLDYVSYRSSERGCQAQAQVAGIRFTMDCANQVAKDILINGAPLSPNGTYELATNNYIAHGGSGFEVLQRNTTQIDTGISIRDVVQSAIIQYGDLPQPGVCEEDGRITPVY